MIGSVDAPGAGLDREVTQWEAEPRDEAVVVGGGIVGLSIARELAVQGVGVVLLDRDREKGGDATQVAAGMLAPVGEHEFGEEALLPMNLASAELFPGLIEELEDATGIEVGYRREGGLHVALDRDEAAVLERMADLQEESGLQPDRLTPSGAREVEPGLSPSVTSAVLAPGDGAIDPRLLADALEADAVARGATVVRDAPVEGLLRESDGVVGVETTGGVIESEVVVVAAGAETGRLEWLEPGELPPVRPVKGQVVELRMQDGPPVCSRPIVTERVYLVPRPDGRLTVGATVEERGWDREVTAGGVHEMLREAYRVLPDLAEASFLGARAGFRPGTPDNLPIVGSTGTPGLLLATGHYRNGVLLSPLTGTALASMVAEGLEVAPGMEAADPGRFVVRTGSA
ncbi:MAG: glycine oxidase ThiO [Solirubrobacterales bacterium]